MAEHRSVLDFDFGVFDLDGTLIDSMGECGRIFAELLKSYEVPLYAGRQYYYDTTGSPMREQFRGVLKKYGARFNDADIEKLRKEFDERFLACDFDLFPGAKQLLSALVAAGKTLFLSSASSDDCVSKRLRAGKLRPLFLRAFGSTALVKGPSHLESFAKAARKSPGEFAKKTFFCGDGEADMRIGKKAGMYSIGVKGTSSPARLRKAGADRLITSVRVLLKDRPKEAS